jgi:outer membrane protein assembly factor BamD (BamD/ComL family)
MKTKLIASMMLGLAAISMLLFSNGIVSYAQSNSSEVTLGNNTTISSSNSTQVNNSTSQSDNPTVQSIDEAIKALNTGDKDTAKKLLLKAEESLEGKSSLEDAEKRVEAALAALKDGDINSAISHAEEAKKNLL